MKQILLSAIVATVLLFVACDRCSNRIPEFQEYTLEDSVPGKYSVAIRYQHLIGSRECDILERIEMVNYLHFFEESATEPADIEASMQDISKTFARDILDCDYCVDCYLYIDQETFTAREGSVLCYETHVDVYAGGAHGGQSLWYECYSLETGQPYDFGYLSEGAWAEAFNELLYNRLLASEANDGLLINSYKELPPADSVLITDKGLTFVYQPYSIASFAQGILSVEISDDELAATGVPMLWCDK